MQINGVFQATEGVSEDLTNLTKNVVIHAVQGVQQVTAAVGGATLENVRGSLQAAALVSEDLETVGKAVARGLIRGTSEVGAELGTAVKAAAIGCIHGTAEVGAELGKVLKQSALSALQGTGEVTEELGALAKRQALGAIEGGTETTLSLEKALLMAGRVFLRGMAELQAERAVAPVAVKPPVVPTADYSEMPPVVGDKGAGKPKPATR